MGSYIDPFNFKEIFMNYLFGNAFLFSLGIIILISYIAGKFGMTTRIFLVLLFLASVIMAQLMGFWYLLSAIIIAFITFKVTARFTQ
ncbi:MAG: hypothetical protein ACLFUH_10570 [Bacteroidales bacterium]